MAKDKDIFGDRFKYYEGQPKPYKYPKGFPVIARLDGKGFSKFTKGLSRPVDLNFRKIFDEVSKFIIEETHATLVYHQSDEITVVFENNDHMWFDGKVSKIESVLTSLVTAKFNSLTSLIGKQNRFGLFDCRTFQVPSKIEAINAVLWREVDCKKNSISMAARTVFSSKALENKHGQEMIAMLRSKEIDWNEYPASFKYGTYFIRNQVTYKLSDNELNDLPPLHNARKNPEMEFTRNVITKIDENLLPLINHNIQSVVDKVFK